MANTIARIIRERPYNQPEVHRLGSQEAHVEANTWRTFTTAHVNRDGSGFVRVTRTRGYGDSDEVLHYFSFGPENKED